MLYFSEGCDNGCGNNGNCVLINNLYSCVCNDGWEGESCSVRLEMECNDEIDNDQGTTLFKLKTNINIWHSWSWLIDSSLELISL